MSTLSSFKNLGFWFFDPPVVVQGEEPVVFDPQKPLQEPISSNSGSYHAPGLRPSQTNFKTLASGSVVDERKLRRMISNRESARRSRMRKQKHLEDLRNQLNRLRGENRELLNRVTLAVQQEQLIRWENERLRSEAAVLRQRLWNVRQVLVFRQLQSISVHLHGRAITLRQLMDNHHNAL